MKRLRFSIVTTTPPLAELTLNEQKRLLECFKSLASEMREELQSATHALAPPGTKVTCHVEEVDE